LFRVRKHSLERFRQKHERIDGKLLRDVRRRSRQERRHDKVECGRGERSSQTNFELCQCERERLLRESTQRFDRGKQEAESNSAKRTQERKVESR